MKRIESCWVGFLLCLCLVVAGGHGAHAEEAPALEAYGIKHHELEREVPRINRIQALQIGLSNPKIKPAVIIGPDPDGDGPAETALSNPLELAAMPSVLAFVNTNPWDSFPNEDGKKNRNWYAGQPVDIHGLAIANGSVRSDTAPSTASVWFDKEGRVHLGDREADRPFSEAVHGFQQIVKEGALAVGEGGAIHPRTAIGVDKSGTKLWLVVVDGRQRNYSEGMNLHELGSLMIELGCWNATNMDGGGSSVMGMKDSSGDLQVMNRPSDWFRGKSRVRPLPMILTIQSTEQKDTE